MVKETEQLQFPIQHSPTLSREKLSVPESVYMAAYEVYCHIWSAQPAMIDLEGRNCRGGFGIGELTAMLYAKSFQKDEWQSRYTEACKGMVL